MRYDVETSTKKGVVREAEKDEASHPPLMSTHTQTAGLLPVVDTDSENNIKDLPPNNELTIGKEQVRRLIAPRSTGETLREHSTADNECSRIPRLFLNRGVALKPNGESRQRHQQQAKLKLPVLPKQAPIKRPPGVVGVQKSSNKSDISENVTSDNPSTEQKGATRTREKVSLPVISGAATS